MHPDVLLHFGALQLKAALSKASEVRSIFVVTGLEPA